MKRMPSTEAHLPGSPVGDQGQRVMGRDENCTAALKASARMFCLIHDNRSRRSAGTVLNHGANPMLQPLATRSGIREDITTFVGNTAGTDDINLAAYR